MIPETFPYFENKAIGRKLSVEGIHLVMQYVVSQGNAEWEDASHTRCRIMWKSAEVLAGEIYTWACTHGYLNNIFTLFELLSGEEYQDSGFHGTEAGVFRKSLSLLQQNGKCVLIEGESLDEEGVKFI